MARDLRKRLPTQTVTLDSVARRAGVSTATVSRVLNQPTKVNPAMREAVHRAIAALNYVPHGAARALASRRTRTIGAIVPTLKNAIFAACLDALQQRINADGFVLLLATSEYSPERESSELRALLERGVDAIMLFGRAHEAAIYASLEAQRIPFVLAYASQPISQWPYVGFDNKRAAMRVTNHLLDLGHRRFGMIAGVTEFNDRAADRVAGVYEALAARGLSLPADLFIEQPYTLVAGRAAMRSFLQHAQRPTAVVCGNDVLALGALAECRAAAVAVPGSVSIVGFDDLEMASYATPPLTTIRVMAGEIGSRAAEYLLGSLAGRAVPKFVELDIELIVRESSGPPMCS